MMFKMTKKMKMTFMHKKKLNYLKDWKNKNKKKCSKMLKNNKTKKHNNKNSKRQKQSCCK